ncbi:MAG: response regulator [Nitrospirales bacterium]
MALKILLIEDDDEDVSILKSLLPDSRHEIILIEIVDCLKDALKLLSRIRADAILLDLFLPDSRGLDAFRTINEEFPHIPIVLLTGQADEDLALQAVKLGAQDFLPKNQLTGPLLSRSIRYSVTRHQLLQEQQRDETERQALYQLAKKPASPVTAGSYGEQLLEDGSPAIFQDIKNQFLDVLNLALEESKYKVASHISKDLQHISQRLGQLHAGPRDVINLYRSALQEVTLASTPEKAHAYLDEGRLLVLRLMGDVMSYYRLHSLKRSNSSAIASPEFHSLTSRRQGT